MAETEELPGSVEENSPIHGNGEGAGNEGPPGEAEPSAPPQKLPPINGSNDGDGLEGYRQNLSGIEVSSPGGSDEVISSKKALKRAQCGNLSIFLPLRFYVKSIFVFKESHIMAF